jgi:hypothetical protein
VFSLIGHEQGKAIVEEYDKMFLFSILLKCYYHLHPLVESKRGVVDQRVDKDMSWICSINEPTMKLVNREILIFWRYQVDVKDIKCPLQWWEKHESMFPTIDFCARQTLGILGFQIEI